MKNGNSRIKGDIQSKLTQNTLVCYGLRSGVFIVGFESISHLLRFLIFEHVIAGWDIFKQVEVGTFMCSLWKSYL